MGHNEAMAMEPVVYTNDEGKKFSLALLDQEKKKEFSYSQFQDACERERFRAKKQNLDEDQLIANCEHQYMMGHYGVLSSEGTRWIASVAGKIAMFRLCAGCSEDEAALECLANPKAVGDALDKVLSHSFPGLEHRWAKNGNANRRKRDPKEEEASNSGQHQTEKSPSLQQ